MRFSTRSLFVLLLSIVFLAACDHRPGDGYNPEGILPPTPVEPVTPDPDPDPEPEPEPEPEPDPEPTVTIYSFTGTFSMSCVDTYDGSNEKWDVKISTTTARRYNGYSWVKLSGLFYGYDFMDAFGYFDPANKCIRIPANIPDNDNTFYFIGDEGTDYYGVFMPCCLVEDWSAFYFLNDDTDEMWLRVQSNGQLKLGASDYPSKEDQLYADGYTFCYFYKYKSGTPENNYFNVLSNAVFTRKSSYSAPARCPINKPRNKQGVIKSW